MLQALHNLPVTWMTSYYRNTQYLKLAGDIGRNLTAATLTIILRQHLVPHCTIKNYE